MDDSKLGNMESILNSLGVHVEDEKALQRKVIEEKIRNSIGFPNILQPPKVHDIPVLATHTLHTLRKILRDDIKSSQCGRDRDIKLMKYRYFETICQRQDETYEPDNEPLYDDTSETGRYNIDDAASDQDYATSRVSLRITDEKGSPMPNTDDRLLSQQGNVPWSTLYPLSEQVKTRKRMHNVIDLIQHEASRSTGSGVAPLQVVSETFLGMRETMSASISDRSNGTDRDSGSHGSHAATTQVHSSRKRRRGHQGASSVTEEDDMIPSTAAGSVTAPSSNIQCPLCQEFVPVVGGRSADSIMDRHIDRCSRRASAAKSCAPHESYRGSASRRNALRPCDSVVAQGVIDFAEEEEEEGGESVGRDGDWVSLDSDSEGLVVESNDDDVLTTMARGSRGRARGGGGGIGKAIQAVNSKLVDDWEQAVYEERLRRYLLQGQDDIDNGVDNTLEDEDVPVNGRDVARDERSLGGVSEADGDGVDAVRNDSRGELVTEFGSRVDRRAWAELYEYQRQGVRWMWELYQSGSGSGGILGDEMGLGECTYICQHHLRRPYAPLNITFLILSLW